MLVCLEKQSYVFWLDLESWKKQETVGEFLHPPTSEMNRNLGMGKAKYAFVDSNKKEERRARSKEQGRRDKDNYLGIC